MVARAVASAARAQPDTSELFTTTHPLSRAMPHHDFADPKDRHRCQNCGAIHKTNKLNEVKHLTERVAPGEPMPSGECPKCGALCQVIRKGARRAGRA
jgi:hypothetical protein